MSHIYITLMDCFEIFSSTTICLTKQTVAGTPQQTFDADVCSLPSESDVAFEPTAGVQQAEEEKTAQQTLPTWTNGLVRTGETRWIKTHKSFAFRRDARRRRPPGHSVNIHPPQSNPPAPLKPKSHFHALNFNGIRMRWYFALRPVGASAGWKTLHGFLTKCLRSKIVFSFFFFPSHSHRCGSLNCARRVIIKKASGADERL